MHHRHAVPQVGWGLEQLVRLSTALPYRLCPRWVWVHHTGQLRRPDVILRAGLFRTGVDKGDAGILAALELPCRRGNAAGEGIAAGCTCMQSVISLIMSPAFDATMVAPSSLSVPAST